MQGAAETCSLILTDRSPGLACVVNIGTQYELQVVTATYTGVKRILSCKLTGAYGLELMGWSSPSWSYVGLIRLRL